MKKKVNCIISESFEAMLLTWQKKNHNQGQQWELGVKINLTELAEISQMNKISKLHQTCSTLQTCTVRSSSLKEAKTLLHGQIISAAFFFGWPFAQHHIPFYCSMPFSVFGDLFFKAPSGYVTFAFQWAQGPSGRPCRGLTVPWQQHPSNSQIDAAGELSIIGRLLASPAGLIKDTCMAFTNSMVCVLVQILSTKDDIYDEFAEVGSTGIYKMPL